LLNEAASMAVARATTLDIVTALPPFEEVTFWYPDAVLDVDLVGVRQGQIEEDLAASAESLRRTFPNLDVTATVEVGSPQTLLAARTRSSQLTVLGTRGRGAVASVLLGSVSRSVLFHAEGPVMIVPSDQCLQLDRERIGRETRRRATQHDRGPAADAPRFERPRY